MSSATGSGNGPERSGLKQHWNSTYAGKGEAGVSWYEDTPAVSLEMIDGLGAGSDASLVDIGGGASRLVDALLAKGWGAVAVLDISQEAIDMAKARLGAAAARVDWIVADVVRWRPARSYDIWHDRAAFHFLVEAEDREAYVETLRRTLAPGGHAIIATFAPDGPERCSGMPVMRYDARKLAEAIGAPFELVGSRLHLHHTPSGAAQPFQFSVLRRKQG